LDGISATLKYLKEQRVESREQTVSLLSALCSWLFALISALLIGACGSAPLSNSHDSPEHLARAVLDAVERRDIDALNDLALTREEFTSAIWPGFAAHERNLSRSSSGEI
jgi:hypothetical protein